MENVKQVIDSIESNSVAHDIMFASTPETMVIRALKNDVIIKAIETLKAQPTNIEFLVNRFKARLEAQVPNDYYMLGIYVAYVALFSNFSMNVNIKDYLLHMSSQLQADNVLKKLNEIVLKRIELQPVVTAVASTAPDSEIKFKSESKSIEPKSNPESMTFKTGTMVIKINPN